MILGIGSIKLVFSYIRRKYYFHLGENRSATLVTPPIHRITTTYTLKGGSVDSKNNSEINYSP